MVTIELPGDPSSALALLAPVGLAGILDEAGLGPAYLQWTFDETESSLPARPSRAQVRCAATSVDDIAAAVRRHAERHLRTDSWMQARIEGLSNSGKALFSPRSSVKPDDWPGYLAQRETALDRSANGMTSLDWALLAGLGEPAWWNAGTRDAKPDKGASRWEMQLRANGREIVSDRLNKLADAVVRLSSATVARSLVGDDVVDACGQEAKCRCSSGLTPPGPTDCVQAWLGLWGLASLPVVPVLESGRPSFGWSQSPGMGPGGRRFPTDAALPVIVGPRTWRSFRALMQTRQFLDVAAQAWRSEAGATKANSDPQVGASRAWLREQNVISIIRFTVHASAAQNPELQLRPGSRDRL